MQIKTSTLKIIAMPIYPPRTGSIEQRLKRLEQYRKDIRRAYQAKTWRVNAE